MKCSEKAESVISDQHEELRRLNEYANCMAQPIYYEDDTVALKGIKSSFAAQCELELQYSQQLGRLAELCDIVIPWVINQFNSDKIVPPDVVKAADEIMDYVDAGKS